MNRTAPHRHGSAIVTLPNDFDIVITRRFDAPAALVFDAYTTPEHVGRWWGFDTGEWQVCEIDLRVGGTWRWVVIDRGMTVGFHGEYREIDRPTRLVATEAYEGVPDPDANAALNTLTLDERDGVTTMTLVSRYPSKEIRDAVIASGMEGGMQVSFNRLKDLVRAQ